MNRRCWLGIIPILVTCLVYLNSFPGDFHYDDRPLILENPRVTGPNFHYGFFVEHYGGRPLTLWTFRVNHQWSGPDPGAFHLVNVLLHLAAVVGVFLLVLELDSGLAAALLSALLFGIHPLQTQAANYTWSRSMLLMAVFSLGALLLVRRRPWLALCSWQLAMWGRTEALALVVLLLWLQPRRWKPLLLLAAVNLAAFVFGLVRAAPLEVAWSHPNVWAYWLSQPVIFWKYVALMVWPVGLNIDHDVSLYSWANALPALVALIVLAILAYGSRSHVVGFALLWLTVPFAPTWIIPNSDLFNESRAYFAFGGFALLTALIVHGWNKRHYTAIRAGLTVLVVALLIPVTLSRNRLWNDDVALWADAAVKSPRKARVRYNLGAALARRGTVDAARQEFEKARDLNPLDDLSYAALGYCAEIAGEWELAQSEYSRALALNPDNDYAREGRSRVRAHLSALQESGVGRLPTDETSPRAPGNRERP